MYSSRKRSQNLSLLFSQQSLRALPRFCRNQAHWTFCFPTQHGHEKRGNALDGNSSDTLLCFGLPWHSPAAENRVARKRLGHSHKEQRATTHHGFLGGRAAPNVRPYSLKLRFYHPGHFTFPYTRPLMNAQWQFLARKVLLAIYRSIFQFPFPASTCQCNNVASTRILSRTQFLRTTVFVTPVRPLTCCRKPWQAS